MADVDTQVRPPLLDPLFELVHDSDEIAHLVCCRDVSWRQAFCGEPGEHLLTSCTAVCSLCVETAERMLPGCFAGERVRCPVDGRHCPDDEELDAEIARRSLPE